MSSRTILLISDDATFRHHAARELRQRGLEVETAGSLAGGVWLTLHASVDGVVIEATPDSDYSVIALVDRLREQRNLVDVPIAVCLSDSAMLDAHTMYLALRGCSVHGRPLNLDGIVAALTTRRVSTPLDPTENRVPAWS